jgi:hypothetical protein
VAAPKLTILQVWKDACREHGFWYLYNGLWPDLTQAALKNGVRFMTKDKLAVLAVALVNWVMGGGGGKVPKVPTAAS